MPHCFGFACPCFPDWGGETGRVHVRGGENATRDPEARDTVMRSELPENRPGLAQEPERSDPDPKVIWRCGALA